MKSLSELKRISYFFVYAIAFYSCKEDIPPNSSIISQIIADHTIVDRYDDIPQYYIDKVKEMWLVCAGESHSGAIRDGMPLLEAINSKYMSSPMYSGTPEPYTNIHLRVSKATWGDYDNSSGWIYGYGEEDWFTNSTGISRTKAGISYCHANSLTVSAIGFGWCADMRTGSTKSSVVDPVYGCYWYGVSVNGPNGNRCWGLDNEDNAITGNTVNMDTYLSVTQGYIDYCTANNIPTKVFFTTGPVDNTIGDYTDERGYQAYLKHEYIRNYVKADPARILFDYADILCYDDDGSLTTSTWNGHEFPLITTLNLIPEEIGHISNAGGIRLAKAMWWMLARIAGWDGN